MGGSQSSTVISSLSEVCSNIAMSTVQSCEIQSQQDQTIDISNSGLSLFSHYKLEQTTDISAQCFSDVQKQTELQNKLVDAISQHTTSDNVALLGAFGSSVSAARANLTNIVKNNITMENINKSYTAIRQTQTLKATNSGVIGYQAVELTQGAKLFAAATVSEIDKAGIFNTIANSIDQTSAAKQTNPLDFIANIVGKVGEVAGMGVLLIFGVVILVFGGAFMVLGPDGIGKILGMTPMGKVMGVGKPAKTGKGCIDMAGIYPAV